MLCYAVKSYGIQCNAKLFRKYEKGLFRFGNPRFFHFFFDFGLEKSHHQIHLQRILYDFIKLLSIAKHFIAIEKHCTALHSTAQCCTNVQHCTTFYSIAKHFWTLLSISKHFIALLIIAEHCCACWAYLNIEEHFIVFQGICSIALLIMVEHCWALHSIL